MIVFPQEIESKLGFSQIKELVRSKCKAGHAVEFLDKIRPSARYEDIRKWLNQTDEMVRVLNSGEAIPGRDFKDLRVFLKRVRAQGAFLQADEFAELRSLLTLLYEWTRFLKTNKDVYPTLCELTLGFIADLELAKAIETVIDERGEVRSNASPELMAIRSLLHQKEREVRTAINRILKKSIKDDYTDEESSVTIRDGRLVIPVKAEHKRRVPGFIHDESSTGQTVFLEPTEVLELNNEVRDLQYQERREVIRILTKLTDQVRNGLKDLEKGCFFIGLIDFIHAKAQVAQILEATKPKLVKFPQINWLNTRHPILWLSNQASGKSTVPLSLKLTREENRILVISGPNAGGKSVALKTVGLVQYMLQCGLLVPVDEFSEFGVFNGLLLDIGDTQSLENDLSTYSSHLKAMRYFNEMADKRTLVLIDEFGTGTEPQFGGAIAESILNQINRKKSFGVVTTHYQNLKKFSEMANGVVNGAMKYDVKALEPLFELEIGKPGSSFAFEIATKIGLPTELIKEAKSLVGDHQVNYERLLNELEQERNEYQSLGNRLKKDEREINDLRADYEQMKSMVEVERKNVIKAAREEAHRIIENANKEIEKTIRTIKETQADQRKTKEARERLNTIKKKQQSKVPLGPKKSAKQLNVGDFVRLDEHGSIGQVLRLKGKQAQVQFGNVISFLDVDRLTRTVEKQNQPSAKKQRAGGINILDKMSRFSGELDIRGMRVEEALVKSDEYVDQAILLGTDNVRIIHGKGHGILKEMIRNHLKDHPNIESMSDEHEDYGGSGTTVITLR